MKRGIIVDVNERFLTLLTEEGEFLRSKRYEAHYEIGQELDFYPVEEKKRLSSNHFKFLKSKPIIACGLLFAFVVSFLLLPVNEESDIYAYMSIDINPSIEICVNEKYQVIDMISYNKDGENIVANIPDWKKKDFDLVISDIIDQLKIQGFVDHNKDVLIGTVVKNEVLNEKQLNQHMDHLKNEMEKEMFNVKLVEGTETERSLAKEQGVTIGQYKEKQSSDKNKEQEEQQEKSRVEEKPNRSDADIEPVNETLMKSEKSTKASHGSEKSNDSRSKNNENNGSLGQSDNAKEAEKKKEKQSEKKEKHHHKDNDVWKNEQKEEKHSEERQRQPKHKDRDNDDNGHHRQQQENNKNENNGNNRGNDRRNDSSNNQPSHDHRKHKEWKDNEKGNEN